LIVRVENRAAGRLRLRIEGSAKSAATPRVLLRPVELLSDVRQLNGLLLQTGRLFGPMQRAVTQSGLRVTVGTIVLASACLAGIVYLVLYRITRLPLVAVAGGALAMTIPYLLVEQARARRVRQGAARRARADDGPCDGG
jgi:Flp pilus assembly protein TadB